MGGYVWRAIKVLRDSKILSENVIRRKRENREFLTRFRICHVSMMQLLFINYYLSYIRCNLFTILRLLPWPNIPYSQTMSLHSIATNQDIPPKMRFLLYDASLNSIRTSSAWWPWFSGHLHHSRNFSPHETDSDTAHAWTTSRSPTYITWWMADILGIFVFPSSISSSTLLPSSTILAHNHLNIPCPHQRLIIHCWLLLSHYNHPKWHCLNGCLPYTYKHWTQANGTTQSV